MNKYSDPRTTAVCDTECYRNYWLIYFRSIDSDKRKYFEMYPGHDLDIEGLKATLRRLRIITFNGNGYDVPMISLALDGATNEELKRASDGIIQANVKPWEFYEFHGVNPPSYLDHIDLIEVAPGDASLKIYGGRLHSRRMQDLPIEPNDLITPAQRPILVDYCGNDLQTTIDLAEELAEPIRLRAQMSDRYGIDLRSKSDAQIAEAVVKCEAEKILRKRLKKPNPERAGSFYYKPPSFIKYRTPAMQELLKRVCNTPLVIDRNGRVVKTDGFNEMVVTMGDSTYQMGIGGLHSTESNRTLYTDDYGILIDRDVASYYPALIINNDLTPPAIGPTFQTIYRGIRSDRLKAKRAGDKSTSETLKIVLNGTFGKLGQPGSLFYAPRQMINVTLTGQLALLMCIERLELAGVHVVSANTDGFTSYVPRHKLDLFNAILFDWECDTDFETEEVWYKSLHQRSVNAYIALPFAFDKATGKFDENKLDKPKRKGEYAPSGPGIPASMGLKKNPTTEICTDAVVAYLSKGTPLEDTIYASNDVRNFVQIGRVTGGAIKDGVVLGKAVRWYYAEGETGAIHYRKTGKIVAQTTGAKPCMDLPDEFPDDIDYDWYINEAYAILNDLGVKYVDPYYAGRSGIFFGRLPDQKTAHIIDASNGVALCGRKPASPRIRWKEYGTELASDMRLCPKCKREDSL